MLQNTFFHAVVTLISNFLFNFAPVIDIWGLFPRIIN